MKIGVFSGLRSRLVCLIARRLLKKRIFPVRMNGLGRLLLSRRGSGGPEIKDPKSKKVEKDLHRHLAWIQILCEVDRKFLASLDLRLMTDALFTVALPG
ncbi:MAG TPA: hypothetical protein VFN58_04620 [Candidatus Binatia bacterium]|jgi:hypothetical protein|nr:hypothetical protein [Candidatus Binatia bacterium]